MPTTTPRPGWPVLPRCGKSPQPTGSCPRTCEVPDNKAIVVRLVQYGALDAQVRPTDDLSRQFLATVRRGRYRPGPDGLPRQIGRAKEDGCQLRRQGPAGLCYHAVVNRHNRPALAPGPAKCLTIKRSL